MTLFLLSEVLTAQVFTTYYEKDGIWGRINTINKIIDYKSRDQNELRFYNEKDTRCKISGFVKIRYTELSTGKQDFKEKSFELSVNPGQNSIVNCYFNPSWSRYVGIYEPVSFYVSNVSFVRQNSASTNNSPRFFRTRTTFYGENHDSKQTDIYNNDGTCSAEGYTLVNDYWIKGTSQGQYHLEGNVIIVTWDDWLKETYVINQDQYYNGPLLMKRL